MRWLRRKPDPSGKVTIRKEGIVWTWSCSRCKRQSFGLQFERVLYHATNHHRGWHMGCRPRR